jgi:hypothetical protein
MGGDPKVRVDGSMSGEWDAGLQLLSGINGTFTARDTTMNLFLGGNATEQITVEITDGRLRGGLQADGLPGGATAGGYLVYTITGSDSGVLDSGQFNFFTRAFAPSADPFPNSIDYPSPGDDFALWGNNWVNGDPALESAWMNLAASLGLATAFDGQPNGTESGFLRLGTDLRGPGTAPEPHALVLLGVAVAFLGYRRLRAA